MCCSANQLLEKINGYIKSMPYSRPPMGLYEPIAYELSLGGKRVRPVLMLMAYNLYKDDIERILPQAVGLETYHNHTLLHDDDRFPSLQLGVESVLCRPYTNYKPSTSIRV